MVLRAFVAIALLANSSGVYAQTPAPILVAYAGQNETVGPMWVGIERATFRKYGLDVRMVQLRNGSLSMSTLASGQVQYNYGSPANALSAAAGGMRLQCVASAVQKIPRELIARKDIRTLQDLRGKTFGVQSIGGGFWLQTMIALDFLGIDPTNTISRCASWATPPRSRRRLAAASSTPTVIPYSFSETAKRAGANVLADIGKLPIPYQGTTLCFLARHAVKLARHHHSVAQRPRR
jgi:NitT/TauT family transport system substrate-binding protein